MNAPLASGGVRQLHRRRVDQKPRRGRTFDDVNPADTRDVVGRFQASSAEDARAAVAAAAAAFDGWRRTPISKRAKVLLSAADYLEAHAAPFAEELTREEGKSVALAKDEVLRSAQTLRFYAIEGQSFSGETFPNDDPEMLVYSAREPLGVVSVITPWNFPISIPARKIAPALITGNTVVFKPSSDAPLIGYRLAEALVQAGLPQGRAQLRHRRRRRGRSGRSPNRPWCAPSRSPARPPPASRSTAPRRSPRAPRWSSAARTRCIVMEDADLDKAVDLAIKGGLSLTGQACTGTSRLLVHSAVKAAFTDRLVAKVKALKIGSGMDPKSEIGPLATSESSWKPCCRYVDIGKQRSDAPARRRALDGRRL